MVNDTSEQPTPLDSEYSTSHTKKSESMGDREKSEMNKDEIIENEIL